MKLKVGETFQQLALTNIHGAPVALPDIQSKWVHLQFLRFAGCPICNLHLQTFLKKAEVLKTAGIHEVLLFHSSTESLLPFQGAFPFDVIGDPEKILYRRFGVESSVFSILNPLAWPAIIKGNLAKARPRGGPEGGPLGLPADVLMTPQGTIIAVHYGTYASDQWTVEQVLDRAKD
jgi:peroxiredoxin